MRMLSEWSARPLPFSEIRYPALLEMSEGDWVERDRKEVMPGPMVSEEEDVGIESPGKTIVDMVRSGVV